jgi:CHASE3 domain sensor protein
VQALDTLTKTQATRAKLNLLMQQMLDAETGLRATC